MKPERRWMKTVLAESAKPGPALPWHRGARQIAARQLAARKRESQSDTGPSARS